MPCWDRHGDQIHGRFSPRQTRWIRKNLHIFHYALRQAQNAIGPERRTTGVSDSAFSWPRGSERVTVIAARRGDAPGEHCSDRSNSVFLEQMRANVETVLLTLPEPGDVVVLMDAQQTWAWIWSLYECGMDVAFRFSVHWGPLSAMCPPGTDRPQRSCYHVLEWLRRVVDDLVDVADLPFPEIGGTA